MRDETDDSVRVAFDSEVEPPVAVDACLPYVAGFIELLCVQGRVLDVFSQKTDLLVKGPAQIRWQVSQPLDGSFGVLDLHRECLVFLPAAL